MPEDFNNNFSKEKPGLIVGICSACEKEKGIDLVTNIDIMKAPTQRLLDLMVEFVHMKKKDITDKQKEVRDLIKKELKERFVNKKKHI